MAGSSVERLVMAYDEHGQLVPTPESEVVHVPVAPKPLDRNGRPLVTKDGGRPMTPSLARFFARGDDELPHALLSIDKATWEGGQAFLSVRLKCAPFVRFELHGKKHMGDTRLVCVFNENDARDPYFAKLPAGDRATILSALREH